MTVKARGSPEEEVANCNAADPVQLLRPAMSGHYEGVDDKKNNLFIGFMVKSQVRFSRFLAAHDKTYVGVKPALYIQHVDNLYI